jgi:hypothetical protein
MYAYLQWREWISFAVYVYILLQILRRAEQ